MTQHGDRLGSRDLLVLLAHSLLRRQLDRTLHDLGRDIERLEEVRLRRVQASRPGRQLHIDRGDHARLGASRHLSVNRDQERRPPYKNRD